VTSNSSIDHHSDTERAAALIAELEPLLTQLARGSDECRATLRSNLDDDTFWTVLDLMKAMSTRPASAVSATFGIFSNRAQERLRDGALPRSDIEKAAALIAELEPLLARLASEGEKRTNTLRTSLGDDTFYAVLDAMKAMVGRTAHRFYLGLPYDGPGPAT
jgi:hypothetical protein